MSATVNALLIAIVVILHSTIRGRTHALHPPYDSPLIHSRDRGEVDSDATS